MCATRADDALAGPARDDLSRVYAVADDGEAALLDVLRHRAGLIWTCTRPDCGWFNPTAADQCEQCGQDRGGQLPNAPEG